MGISCIRSIPADGEERLKCYGTDDIYEIVRLLSDTKVDTVLIDTRDGSNASSGRNCPTVSYEKSSKICEFHAYRSFIFPESVL